MKPEATYLVKILLLALRSQEMWKSVGLQNPVATGPGTPPIPVRYSQAQCQGPGNTTAHRQDYPDFAGETTRASVSLWVRWLSVSYPVLAVELQAEPWSIHSW